MGDDFVHQRMVEIDGRDHAITASGFWPASP
jgi:hypothetical protein